MARTLRGLEETTAHEIEQRGLGTVDHRRHREVWFTAPHAEPGLMSLRTADDLFLVAAVADGIGHTKADLEAFTHLARAASLPELVRTRRQCGGPDTTAGLNVAGLNVAASFLGRRNYNRYDIEDAIGRHAAPELGLRYHSRRDGGKPPEDSLALRVTVEGTQAVLALRVPGRPLHRRSYKTTSTPGTLHPPLAAALGRLADIGPGMRVVDPCCGTGTILIEALDLATDIILLGGDHDRRAVAAATANARAASHVTPITWAVADAGRMPLRSGTIDRIVSNPPWDRQVEARGRLTGQPRHLYDEIRRTLAPGGRAVLLLHEAEEQLAMAEAAGLRVVDTHSVSLFGAHPSIVTLRPEN